MLNAGRVLIINDSFGALSVALSHCSPQVWGDSWLGQQALRANLVANDLETTAVTWVDSVAIPQGPVDLVLIKVPKTLALLEDQLIRLRPLLTSSTQILVAGMQKALPRSVWPMLERLLGSLDTALAWKKAKLIRVKPNLSLPLPSNPYPSTYKLEGTDWLITNHANVFSRDGLDIGTRFFLQHLPQMAQAQDVVDLGCGNGLLGLHAAVLNSGATIHFIDESFMAVASARTNVEDVLQDSDNARFHVADGLEGFESGSVDLVLCNPPFHQQQAVGDHIAQRMFEQAYLTLRTGGELHIVGNRHLGYHVVLKKLFGNADLVASNAKFVILRCVR
jgi:16S rRNA (guanine1207-N2)-methyltransferase